MGAAELIRQLAEYQRENRDLDLLQFRRLVSGHQYLRLYDLVNRHVRPGSDVLDWGCGNGHASYVLSRLGFRTVGFTLQDRPPIADIASACEFVCDSNASDSALPFQDQQFDAVVSVGVLEHVHESGGTELGSLREIHRVLKPNGVFACYHLPNKWSYIEALARAFPNAYRHQYRFTRSDVHRLCGSAGLSVIDFRSYGALPRNFWHLLPRRVGDSPAVAHLWDELEIRLELVLSPILQNHCFVARRIRA